ncbi:hypothetical protein [Streptomyces sp. NPDC053720]|uniref:hypothetical protein n=1 Tax=Streptomyces sp. NPDC053720 TaxID=3154855 RepID=UPI00343D8934
MISYQVGQIMRTIAIKSVVAAAGSVLLLAPSASSAPMSGSDDDGGMSISVEGKGLHVSRITVSSAKQRANESFRVYRHTGSAATQSYVTKWKKARVVDAGMTKFSVATWKVNERFSNGTWLCAVATKTSGNPCIKVHH